MATWYVDKGLGLLIALLRARFPGIVIGTIGDEEHRARKSGHNPEADGSVDAADPTIGPHFTFANAQWLVNQLVASRDPRIAFIIWNRRIISSTVSPWTWRPYLLADPHTGHVHIEVNDLHENDLSPWDLGDDDMTPKELLAYDGVTNRFPDAKTNPTIRVETALEHAARASTAEIEARAAREGVEKLLARPAAPTAAVTLPDDQLIKLADLVAERFAVRLSNG